MRAARLVIGLIALAAVFVVLAVVLRSAVLLGLAVAAFAAVFVVILIQTGPSLRYRQSVKYDHSFLTHLAGETSTPHPGPAAEREKASE